MKKSYGSLSVIQIIQIVFIVLRLCGLIVWPWWVVLIPLWIELFFSLIAAILLYIAVK